MYLFTYSITNYNYSDNKITPQGVEAIMDAVGSSYSITSLDISSMFYLPFHSLPSLVLFSYSYVSVLSLSISISSIQILFKGNEVSTKVTAACAHMLSTNPLISYLVVGDMYDCCSLLLSCYLSPLLPLLLPLPPLPLPILIV